MSLLHSYGPTCHHAPSVSFSGSKDDNEVPAIKAQFFYSSPLPIDDPLSAVPVPTGSESGLNHPPRPFSAYDNNALEEAWLNLCSSTDRKNHRKSFKKSQKPSSKKEEKWTSVIGDIAQKHHKKHTEFDSSTFKSEGSTARKGPDTNPHCECESCGCVCKPNKEFMDIMQDLDRVRKERAGKEKNQGRSEGDTSADLATALDLTIDHCCAELADEVKAEFKNNFSGILKKMEGKNVEDLVHDVMGTIEKHKTEAASKESPSTTWFGSPRPGTPRNRSPMPESKKDSKKPQRTESPRPGSRLGEKIDAERSTRFKEHVKTGHPTATDASSMLNESAEPGNQLLSTSAPEKGTTGFPFVRAPSRTQSPRPSLLSRSSSTKALKKAASKPSEPVVPLGSEELIASDSAGNPVQELDEPVNPHNHHCKAQNNTKALAEVPVGASRLHLVKLPALQMMPIYWSPVHDIATVTRATWFYRDTMLPVEPAVANRLEKGYRELRPWSQTWNDELSSALEVGAAGEEKITFKLWPGENDKGEDDPSDPATASDPFCAARCFHGEVAAVGSIESEESDGKLVQNAMNTKRFSTAQVIYKDTNNAFILKPSLQPSAYYGRRPLAKIKRGLDVGIHVVRGFDWKAWERLHPPKKSQFTQKAEKEAPVAGNDAAKESSCPACRNLSKKPKVTDLVLVIHGIGQKLSERVESFNFTHAINAFRRSVNMELVNESVQRVLRDDLGGIMVLPVNWRSNVVFEESESGKASRGEQDSDNGFTLDQITPQSIPAVRNLISDVMLDIPFYMSHHRTKMIQALISEANRVYRLWCRNNPGFSTYGNVHIIAHSLGSAMALEVLSRQPTKVAPLQLKELKKGSPEKIQTKHFDFDVKNLFFAGSPAGFFLLLDHGILLPRRGRVKPDADDSDVASKGITGEAGTFGCLAVDNLYNIMHYNDPIAYRLNAAVDSKYAESLKNVQVPSATTGWFESIGNAMRIITPGMAPPTDLGVGQIAKPIVGRLPSQLEMEVHDFTREEIAEKRFYLLNDNGQIDYFLSSGGGPLEIQYLNMLGAHSSYWTSQDFIRMIVTEIGRKPGKTNTLANMKAAKHTLLK